MTLAVLVGYTWISASLAGGGEEIHPAAWWGWPLIASAVLLVAGAYVVLATYFDQWPILGREWTEVDHSTRYVLWFQGLDISWALPDARPGTLDVIISMIMSNGGNAGPIRAHFEKFSVELNGLRPADTDAGTRDLRLLPGDTKTRFFRVGAIEGLATGMMNGTLEYSILYGPPTGFPMYRRTHKINFWETLPITEAMVRTGNFGNARVLWADIEPEQDVDIPGRMPPIAATATIVQGQ